MATLVSLSGEKQPTQTIDDSSEAVTFQEFLEELNKSYSSTEETSLEDYIGLSFEQLTKQDIESVCKNKFTQTIGTNSEGKLLSLRSHGDKTIEMDYYEYEGAWYNVHGEKVALSKVNSKLANYISKIKNEQPAYIFSQIINQYCVENKLNKIIETAISTKTTSRVICGIVGKIPQVKTKTSVEKSTENTAEKPVEKPVEKPAEPTIKKNSKTQQQQVLKYMFLGKLKPYGIFETEILLPTGQHSSHKFYVFCK